jgi:hypothetical protein
MRQYIKKARLQELCKTDLQLLAKEQATQHNTTTANDIKDASNFPLLHSQIKGPQNGSLDELWIPDNPLDLQNTSWTAIIKKQAIFEALLQNGQEHFSQANRHPLCHWTSL